MGATNVCGRNQQQNQKTAKQIKSFEKKYQKEQDEKNNYKQELQLIKKQLQTLRANYQKLEKQRQQLTTIGSDIGEKTIRKQQNFIAQPSSSTENEIREQKQIYKKNEQEYEQKIQYLQKLLKQKDSQNINKNNRKIKDLEQQIQSYEKLMKQKDNQTQQLEAHHIHQLQQKDKQLEQKQQNLQSMISHLRDELQIAKQREEKEEAHYQSILTQLRNTIQSLESQKNYIGMQIDKIRKQLQQKQQMLEQNTKHSEQQKKQIKKSLDELNSKCRQYEEQVKQKDRQMNQLNTKILNTSITQQNQRNSRKQTTVSDLKQKLEQYISERDRIRLSRDRMSRTVAQMKYHSLFNVDLLQDEPDYKQFLVSAIQARMNKKIAKTKLVYKYDEINKLNIHKYIDNKYFLVVIIKLQNGYYVAAFTQGPFYPKMQSKYDGMILSLTNRKAFVPQVKNRRAIAYDDFFVIFGNSEVRLKSQQKKLFSNFAINNGYYNASGEKVNILLGTNIREVPLESYEFYEIVFK